MLCKHKAKTEQVVTLSSEGVEVRTTKSLGVCAFCGQKLCERKIAEHPIVKAHGIGIRCLLLAGHPDACLNPYVGPWAAISTL